MRGRLFKIVMTLSVLFAGSFVLSACGQKGPLYLPAEKTTAKADTAAEKKEEKSTTEGSTAR